MGRHEENCQLFKENIEPHHTKILKFLMYASQDPDLARDITQDTMESAWKNIEHLCTYTNIEAGLIQIAKNHLRKHYRKNPVCIPIEEIVDTPALDETLEDIVQKAETGEVLKKLFDCLDEKHAQVLILHYYYNQSFKAIAEMYGANHNTVLSQHTRSLKKLRESLNKLHEK